MNYIATEGELKEDERKQWGRDHKFPKVKEGKNVKIDSNVKVNILKEEIAYKYSNKGKKELRESVVIEGTPYFLKYVFTEENNKSFTNLEPNILETTRIIRPPHLEEYPYEPYEFTDVGEPQYYLRKAIKETIDSIYQKIKKIVSQFNDVDSNTIVLLSGDILGSYFQDRFSTVHYLIIVGDNGTGKSAIGDTFESLGYRAVNMTDATPATWFRVLGSVEYGQVTIIADEAEKIGESVEVMSILKTGYQPKGKVFRMDSDNRRQQFFYPFCFKIIIAKKSPGETTAKGLLDRSFKIKTYKGLPQFDIKEVRNPQGNLKRQQQLDDINNLRKLLLMFKLLHFKDPLPEVDVGLDGRDKELCKPILQLFYGLNATAETIKEIETAMQHFLDIKNERKKNSLEAVIYPVITNAISRYGKEIETGQIWTLIVETLDGNRDESKPSIFYSSDYGKIYRNTITKMICDKFGAEKRHKENGNVLIFNDYVFKVGKLYGESKTIFTMLKPDSSDAPDAFIEVETSPSALSDIEIETNRDDFVEMPVFNSQIDKDLDQNDFTVPQDETSESGESVI